MVAVVVAKDDDVSSGMSAEAGINCLVTGSATRVATCDDGIVVLKSESGARHVVNARVYTSVWEPWRYADVVDKAR